MADVSIAIEDNRQRFYAGETFKGAVDMLLDEDVPMSNVIISFHCLGEVKWVEYPGTPYYLNGFVYYDKFCYLDKEYTIPDANSKVVLKGQKISVPFEFEIPKCKDLPSTMISTHGFIQYFVKVTIRTNDEIKKIVKEIIVEAPIDENLMITVGSTVEKNVLLHGGHVSMHASINRKGFAPGETIDVHISVNNKSNAKVVPRISLYQIQIYQCGTRHKSIETTLGNDPIIGKEIAGNSEAVEILSVKIPSDESLTIKSSVITVKYYVHVTLDIPHSLDLHVNLPIVLTSTKTIEALRHSLDGLPQMVAKESK